MSINYVEAYRLIQRGRRADRRRAVTVKVVQAVITGILLALIKGWFFMLAIGVAHAGWWPAIPTIGFWWAVLFMAMLPSFGSTSRKSSDD